MWVLTHKGKYVKDYGSPEFRVYSMINSTCYMFEKIVYNLGQVGKDGCEKCIKDGYLEMDNNFRLSRKKEFIKDYIQEYLIHISNGYIYSKQIMLMLKKRNLIENINC
jgi:hypothetical protein